MNGIKRLSGRSAFGFDMPAIWITLKRTAMNRIKPLSGPSACGFDLPAIWITLKNKIKQLSEVILLAGFQLLAFGLAAQEREVPIGPLREQQLENQTERTDIVSDDEYQQRITYLTRHPIHLNVASAEELRETGLLTEWQVNRFMQYRKLFGRLISIYELQAIPGWDLETIRQLLPYIVVKDEQTMTASLASRLKGGEQSLLLRFSRALELPKEFEEADTLASAYSGTALKMMARYKYNYRDLLQFGWVGDKDAGERFFKGAQGYGFDFNSFHFFARKLSMVKALAVGDFSVNMGQGLIQWQSQAFKKGSDVLAIKRQGPVLKPYNSAGEFNFHRGIGVTIGTQRWELTVFGSMKKLSAHLDIDTVHGTVYISSLLPTGYHRTKREQEQKNNVTQLAAGATARYNTSNAHFGVNAVHYLFSVPFRPSGDAYDIFSLAGKVPANYSVDYSYTLNNIHFFGEAAIDEQGHRAMVNGLLMSADALADISIMHRDIDRAYHSLYSNAFTERTVPANEKGCYVGMLLHPVAGFEIGGYADLFCFPWLQYRVDKPALGHDYLLSLTCNPNRNLEISGIYRTAMKEGNVPAEISGMHPVQASTKSSWRMQTAWQMNRMLSWKSRMELLWLRRTGSMSIQRGFLYYMDINCRSLLPSLGGNIRWQYAEADSYDARLYAYENDVLFGATIPAFYGKSWRLYLNLHYAIKKIWRSGKGKPGIGLWLRTAYTKFSHELLVQDKYNSDHQLEWKAQVLFEW